MLCTVKWVKKVYYGGVFSFALNNHNCSENYTKTKNPLNGALPGLFVQVGSYTWCSDCTSVCLCAASLQNLVVPQNFYSPLSVSRERSC